MSNAFLQDHISIRDFAAQTQHRANFETRTAAIWQWLQRAKDVHLQRRRLARLNDRQLHDIGITRADAQHEASRPFWDFP